MSMLAEKRRKQKWSLNPRGNDWVQDSSKFGQKMLEKMGWQHGKGLGAKEDGITAHIKVSYKNDSKGMGYKESNDQWTEHETNFSALLESLSGSKSNEVKLNSLEKKSQSSRVRVHYHKFTRGKDLSRYSEKDLANIFGKKTLKESPKVKAAEEKPDSTEERNDNGSKFLFNAGSMRDYFKKKLPVFGKSNGYAIGQNGVLQKEEPDSETDMRPSFSYNYKEKDDEDSNVGFGFKSEVVCGNDDNVSKLPDGKATFVSYVNGNDQKEPTGKKKRKGEVNEVDNVFSPKKKMRKPKGDVPKSSDSEYDKGVSNPAFNPLQTPIKVEKHILDTIEETVSEEMSDPEDDALRSIVTTVQIHKMLEQKEKHVSDGAGINFNGVDKKVKKKCKKSMGLENGFVNNTFVNCDVADLTLDGSKENEMEVLPYEIKRKGVKEKKKENKLTDDLQIEEDPCELRVKKMKKKKTGMKMDEDISVDLTIEDSEECQFLCEFKNSQEVAQDSSQTKESPHEIRVKKNKKKNRENETEVENLSIDLTTDSGVSSVTVTVSKMKKKNKKKRKEFVLENPSFDEVLEESVDLTRVEENPYEVKVTKKKKDVTGGIDNVNFNGSTESSTICSQSEENPYEVKIVEKKKKKKKEKENYAIENPNFLFENRSFEEPSCNQVEENPYEVKPKKKKKKKDLAIDNPTFNGNDSVDQSSNSVEFKEEGTKKKTKDNSDNDDNASSSTTLDTPTVETNENMSINIEDSDLMLNVVTTPIFTKSPPKNGENIRSVTKVKNAKRRKNVRFSDVTQEKIIPNNDDLRSLSDTENRKELFEINTQVINKGLEQQDISFDMSALDKIGYDDSCEKLGKKKKLGLDNAAFDKHKTNLEENVESISKTIDRYQAEIENDINEKKLETLTMEDVMVGEIGNPHGDNEKLSEGTKLKFKYASFTSRTPFYQLDKTGAKKSYRHLIKGDIVVGFKNTNLHEIQGYAIKNKSREV